MTRRHGERERRRRQRHPPDHLAPLEQQRELAESKLLRMSAGAAYARTVTCRVDPITRAAAAARRHRRGRAPRRERRRGRAPRSSTRSSPCARAGFARSTTSPGSSEGGAIAMRSDGRSVKSDPIKPAGATPSSIAQRSMTTLRGSPEKRPAVVKSAARASRGGSADFRWERARPRRRCATSLRLSSGAPGAGSRRRASSSRTGRPLNRSHSSISVRTQGRSASPRNLGIAAGPRNSQESRLAGSKAFAPPSRLRDLGGAAHDELVHDRGLPFLRAEESPDALHVLSLPLRSPNDNRDVGVGHVDTFVEDPRRDQRAQLAPAETLERHARARRRTPCHCPT